MGGGGWGKRKGYLAQLHGGVYERAAFQCGQSLKNRTQTHLSLVHRSQHRVQLPSITDTCNHTHMSAKPFSDMPRKQQTVTPALSSGQYCSLHLT